MPTKNSSDKDIMLQAQANSLHSIDRSLSELNARIARLGMALGISLEKEEEIQRILNHQPKGHPMHAEQGPEFQKNEQEHVLIELRGLIIMRYEIERHIAQDQGATVTRQVLEQVQVNLKKHGFKPGADGLDIDKLFKST